MITLTDMFCGCGGSTEGASGVDGVAVTMAMNHWRLAVESHNTNHPDTDHDCADISETHPSRYKSTVGLIGSPECTNHSLAKGARRTRLNQGDFFQSGVDPAAVRSRATMWDIVRFAEVHRYEFVITENVVDVRRWSLFDPWLAAMHALGYRHRCVYLNAMHAHGAKVRSFAPQSRDRIYIVFWKKGNPPPDLDIRPAAPCAACGCVVEAVQSWKNGRTWGKYRTQYVYRCPTCTAVVEPFYYAALNALDLSLPAERIGDRARPLRPKTLARIEYGLRKYGLRELVVRDFSTSGVGHRVKPADEAPLPSQVGYGHSDSVLMPYLVETAYTHAPDDRARSVGREAPSQTSRASMALVSPFLMANRTNSPPRGLGEAMHTACTGNAEFVVQGAPFIPRFYGQSKATDVLDPLGTASGEIHDGLCLTPSALLTLRGPRHLSGIDEAAPTQVAAGIQNWMVQSRPFLTSYYGGHQASDMADPHPTVTGGDRHALVEAAGALPIGVEDCYFRMLQPHEMQAAQGFPADYTILGTKRDRVKQIGNANPPPTMELLVQRCAATLNP